MCAHVLVHVFQCECFNVSATPGHLPWAGKAQHPVSSSRVWDGLGLSWENAGLQVHLVQVHIDHPVSRIYPSVLQPQEFRNLFFFCFPPPLLFLLVF